MNTEVIEIQIECFVDDLDRLRERMERLLKQLRDLKIEREIYG